MNSERSKFGFELAFLANLLWGTSFVAAKYTVNTWGPFTTSVLRFAFALLFMALLAPYFGGRIRFPKKFKQWKSIFLVGVTAFALLCPLQLKGLQMIPSGLSAAIMLVSPLLLLLVRAMLSEEKLCQRGVFSVGLGIVGGLLLLYSNNAFASFQNTQVNLIYVGVLFTLGAALSLVFSIVATGKATKEIDTTNLTFWSLFVSLVVLMPFAWNEKQPHGEWHASSWIALLYLALVCSALCSLMWNRAISSTSSRRLAPTMHIKTPVAILLGVLIANESISFWTIVGTLIISVAIRISARERALINDNRVA